MKTGMIYKDTRTKMWPRNKNRCQDYMINMEAIPHKQGGSVRMTKCGNDVHTSRDSSYGNIS